MSEQRLSTDGKIKSRVSQLDSLCYNLPTMNGRELMTHFTAANLIDVTTTIIGSSLPASPEGGAFKWWFNSAPDGESVVLAFKCLTIAYLVAAYALSEEHQFKGIGFCSKKVMQITTPLIYSAAAINLFQIAVQLFGNT